VLYGITIFHIKNRNIKFEDVFCNYPVSKLQKKEEKRQFKNGTIV